MASHFYENLAATFSRLATQSHHQSKMTITLTVFVAALVAISPFAYRDYKTYMSYGPGGPPHNVFGWFAITTVLRPMMTEMFSTGVYDDMPDKRSWLPGSLKRRGERPVVGPHAAPQRQLNQVPGNEIRRV